MKTKTWLFLIGAFCLLCAAATVLLPLLSTQSAAAEVYSDGVLVLTLDLSKNGEYTVRSEYGENVLRVEDGKVCVTAASCANQDCMRHEPSDSGAPIVCLPNRMVVRFPEKSTLDAVVG